MRCTSGEFAELWISDIHSMFGIKPRVVQEYWSENHRIVRPSIEATGQGGRNIYKPKDVVKLLVAKQLAENGMKLEEVAKVIRWMETKTVKLIRYPYDLKHLQRYDDTGEYKWTSGDPRGEEKGWWDAVTFDPFPDQELATACYGKTRGYPHKPENVVEWKHYWGAVAQFILIDRHRTGLTSPQILLPLHWLHSPHGRFIRIHHWFNQAIGDLAFEPVLRWGHESLTTSWLFDIAMVKRRVADVLLSPPENVEETNSFDG